MKVATRALSALPCLAGVLLLAAPLSQLLAENVASKPTTTKATFAGGCFWCMEPPFEKLDGVLSVTSGYIGGKTVNPSYEDVSAGGTGHAEAVQIEYDPKRISYEKLLDVFWHNVDPTTANAQFCDHGSQYRSGIFYHTEDQKRRAEGSKLSIQTQLKVKLPIVTEITAATTFYAAEDYHQDYYKRNPVRYRVYRYNCGRDARLEEVWGAAATH